MLKNKLTIIAASALLLASCGRSGWSVEGTVEGATDGMSLALEANNAGRWYVIDSVKVAADGRFDYQAAEPMPSADILRLQLPGKGSIYFPVDSVDAIIVEADAATFGTGHSLKGTELASRMSAIDSIVAATPSVDELRRKLVGFVTSDTTGLIAYYTVGKAVDNKPVFDPNENLGNRIYGAAAQVYAHYKPLDPRGAALRKAYFEGRRNLGKLPEDASDATVIEVPETSIIDIVRYDDRGVEHSLKDLASKGKVVLLSFTDYGMEKAPAYNSMLNELYTLYSPKGFEIYQIAFDQNEVAWKEAARNLPWITVWNSPADGVAPLALYNVGALPMTFIINSKGEISKRVADPSELAKEVAKYF
ncbi:MAG: redoxin domain-containing protein [Muribaculaceae bacterium]|nr:redoxin domain-containing protein [Muribaculaceae bacterium]